MALIPCAECGNQISTAAPSCPKCGSPQRPQPVAQPDIPKVEFAPGVRKPNMGAATAAAPPPKKKTSTGTKVVLALFVLFVIGKIIGSSGSAGASEAPKTRAAVTSNIPMPDDQKSFCNVLNRYATEYRTAQQSGANELKLSKLRSLRAKDIRGVLSRSQVEGWTGTLKNVATTGDGKASVELTLPCGALLKTWNNGFSDLGDRTLIAQSSPLYDSIAELGAGKVVRVAGRLVSEGQDGFKETSMSELGSMTDPEFLFRFSSVSAM